MTNPHDILLRPVLSEKSYGLIGTDTYTFIVKPTATKPQIKQAVEEVFGVEVESVHTLRKKGKIKRQGRTQGRTAATKKAYVQLKKGQKKIEFFENMAQ